MFLTEKKRKYKCDDIPVVFFNFETEKWEAVNPEVESANIIALYKNQTDLATSRQAATSLYASRATRMERPQGSKSARRNSLVKGLTFVVLAIVFYTLWLWFRV